MKNFFDSYVVSHRENLFLNGFTIIKKKDVLTLDEYLKNISQLETNSQYFEKQLKQKGVFTLKASVQQKYKKLFIDILFKSNIYELSCFITGQKLYLTNFKHYLTRGKTKELGWHRDTYFRDNKFHGMLPSGYKLAIYGSDVLNHDGCTAFVKGSHRIDFNNNFFDIFLSRMTKRVEKITLNKGDSVLFNVNLLHNRLQTKYESSIRSATIYGFALSNFYQNNYKINDNDKIINYFNKKLTKVIQW
jgi:hypothetical protein